jgi:uncharacterized protein YcbX
MAFDLPLLPPGVRLVGDDGQATQRFSLWWQRLVEKLEAQEAAQDTLIQQLSEAVAAIQAAQEAADAANAAAAAANAAAADAAAAIVTVEATITTVEAAIVDLDTRVTALEP